MTDKFPSNILEWLEMTLWWPITHRYRDFRWAITRFFAFFERGWKGYSRIDVWDFGSYLNRIIPGALRQLANGHYGCPGELYDEKAVDDEGHRWREILEKIANDITALDEFDDWQVDNWKELDLFKTGKELNDQKYKEAEARTMEARGLLIKWWNSLWD